MTTISSRPWTTGAPSSLQQQQQRGGDSMGMISNNNNNTNSSSGNAMSNTSGSGNGGNGGGIQELDELHRRYRIMELSRKASHDESSNTLRMQRQQIEKLKKDNERLKEDLALETRQARQANNQSTTSQISKLQDQGDSYTRKIEIERRKLEDLDKNIKKLQSSILIQRKEMGGINATRDTNNNVQKQIRILENRLDKALIKFNEALAHNKSLRESIDNLRRERVVFDGIYNKLSKELDKKKQSMNEIMQEANIAYEQRNAAQSEMIHLKELADKEQARFEEEWKELGVMIEKERKMKDFMNKSSKGSDGRLIPSSTGGGSSTSRGVDPAIEEESSLRKKVTKGAWGIATDKANIHLSMEKVQSYEEAFAKIQKATKITDIDELVHTFVHAEDENFSLFNYVNDLSNEIEKVQEQIESVRKETTRFRGAGENTDATRKKLLVELESKIEKNQTLASTANQKFLVASTTLNSLKTGVNEIFTKLGCESLTASELLGTTGVTESNMMQYLGLIEQRTNELIQVYKEQKRVSESLEGDASVATTMVVANSKEKDSSLAQTRIAPTNSTKQHSHQQHSSSSQHHSQHHNQQPPSSDSLSIHAPSTQSFEEEEGEEQDPDEDVQPLDISRQRHQQRASQKQEEEHY